MIVSCSQILQSITLSSHSRAVGQSENNIKPSRGEAKGARGARQTGATVESCHASPRARQHGRIIVCYVLSIIILAVSVRHRGGGARRRGAGQSRVHISRHGAMRTAAASTDYTICVMTSFRLSVDL